MYANDFFEIPAVVSVNESLRTKIEDLIKTRPTPGKALEGSDREDKFRDLLLQVLSGEISLQDSYLSIEQIIPTSNSPHSGNNRVFPNGWGERLVRIQLSRFYNQAILEELQNNNVAECYIPHSNHEASDSICTIGLAGKKANVSSLLTLLIDTYEKGNFRKELKIPNHPHCTHVVRPI
jgi:hypothetical protein